MQSRCSGHPWCHPTSLMLTFLLAGSFQPGWSLSLGGLAFTNFNVYVLELCEPTPTLGTSGVCSCDGPVKCPRCLPASAYVIACSDDIWSAYFRLRAPCKRTFLSSTPLFLTAQFKSWSISGCRQVTSRKSSWSGSDCCVPQDTGSESRRLDQSVLPTT